MLQHWTYAFVALANQKAAVAYIARVPGAASRVWWRGQHWHSRNTAGAGHFAHLTRREYVRPDSNDKHGVRCGFHHVCMGRHLCRCSVVAPLPAGPTSRHADTAFAE